jgi:hypothetical protein
VIQTALILDRLQILDQNVWNKTGTHVLRLLHKFKGRDLALMLDVFDKDILDEEGEAHNIRKAPIPSGGTENDFFERLVSLLPM